MATQAPNHFQPPGRTLLHGPSLAAGASPCSRVSHSSLPVCMSSVSLVSTRAPTSPLMSSRATTSPLASNRAPTTPLMSTRAPATPLMSTRATLSPTGTLQNSTPASFRRAPSPTRTIQNGTPASFYLTQHSTTSPGCCYPAAAHGSGSVNIPVFMPRVVHSPSRKSSTNLRNGQSKSLASISTVPAQSKHSSPVRSTTIITAKAAGPTRITSAASLGVATVAQEPVAFPHAPMRAASNGFIPEGMCTIALASDPSLSLDFDITTPLGKVRDRLAMKFNIEASNQRLLCGSREVDLDAFVSSTLSSLDIVSGMRLLLAKENSAHRASGSRGGIVVTVRIDDGKSFSLPLKDGSSTDVLKRLVSQKTGIPQSCLFLRLGHEPCTKLTTYSDGDIIDVQDNQLQSIGPFTMRLTAWSDSDFCFPRNRQDLRSGHANAISIGKPELEATCRDLGVSVKKWPLLLCLSPLAEVTLRLESKENKGIPREAQYFAYIYPACVDWRAVNTESEQLSVPEVELLVNGGYMYFTKNFEVLAVNSITTSPRGGLCFSEPKELPHEASRRLWLDGRVHRVTAKKMSELGIYNFAWINPGETFDGKVLTNHGGFAYFYTDKFDAKPEDCAGDRYFSIIDVDVYDEFSALVENDRARDRQRTGSCFSRTNSGVAGSGGDRTPLMLPEGSVMQENSGVAKLSKHTQGYVTNWDALDRAVENMRNPHYSTINFFNDVCMAFPEFELYRAGTGGTSSGRSGEDEYQRTIGALFAVFWLMRMDIDGKEAFCFGVDEETSDIRPAPDVELSSGLVWASMNPSQRKVNFYSTMCWDKVVDLFVAAGLLKPTGNGAWTHDHVRTRAMLVLTAIHDIMKNDVILPSVDEEHAPFEGHKEGIRIRDHDIALAYVLTHYPHLLPSYGGLDGPSRRSILFTQGQMAFNNGWFVQAEAPPGPLFHNLCELISKGAAPEEDVAFYFVHWLTDLAAAEPTPFEGMIKYTVNFPDFVLRAFMESFPFIWKLADQKASDVYLNYLEWRWGSLGLERKMRDLGDSAVALARLCVSVQSPDKAKKVSELWSKLNDEDRNLLTKEMSLTGVQDEVFAWGAPKVCEGPAILIYYGPALALKHLHFQDLNMLKVIAEIYRAGRTLYPASPTKSGEFVTLQVAALKALNSADLFSVNNGNVWVVAKRTEKEAPIETHRIVDIAAGAAPPPAPVDDVVAANYKPLDVPYVVLPFWPAAAL